MKSNALFLTCLLLANMSLAETPFASFLSLSQEGEAQDSGNDNQSLIDTIQMVDHISKTPIVDLLDELLGQLFPSSKESLLADLAVCQKNIPDLMKRVQNENLHLQNRLHHVCQLNDPDKVADAALETFLTDMTEIIRACQLHKNADEVQKIFEGLFEGYDLTRKALSEGGDAVLNGILDIFKSFDPHVVVELRLAAQRNKDSNKPLEDMKDSVIHHLHQIADHYMDDLRSHPDQVHEDLDRKLYLDVRTILQKYDFGLICTEATEDLQDVHEVGWYYKELFDAYYDNLHNNDFP